MNPYIIGGLVGVVIGAGITYLAIEPSTRRKLQAEFDSDLEEMREYYKIDSERELDILSNETSDVDLTVVVKDTNPVNPGPDNAARYHTAYKQHEGRVKGLDIKKLQDTPELEMVLQKEDIELEIDPEYAANEPEYILDPELFGIDSDSTETKSVFMVDSDEYNSLDPDADERWDKVSLNYYAEDDVLVFEETGENEVIVDRLGFIGSIGDEILRNWYSEEWSQDVEDDSIYIRNEIRSTYYQVMYFEEKFYTDN